MDIIHITTLAKESQIKEETDTGKVWEIKFEITAPGLQVMSRSLVCECMAVFTTCGAIYRSLLIFCHHTTLFSCFQNLSCIRFMTSSVFLREAEKSTIL